MYLSSETLEDATVSCPLWEYTVGYFQCLALSTWHNVESCGTEVSTRTYPDWVELVGTPVKDFLSWVDWGGKIHRGCGYHRVKGWVSTECREGATTSADTLIHCSPLAFDGGCKMASSLKLLMLLWTVTWNCELEQSLLSCIRSPGDVGFTSVCWDYH